MNAYIGLVEVKRSERAICGRAVIERRIDDKIQIAQP